MSGDFLLFFMMMVTEGIPLFHIRSAVGQRFLRSAIVCWKKMHPALMRVGISCVVISLRLCNYHISLLLHGAFTISFYPLHQNYQGVYRTVLNMIYTKMSLQSVRPVKSIKQSKQTLHLLLVILPKHSLIAVCMTHNFNISNAKPWISHCLLKIREQVCHGNWLVA